MADTNIATHAKRVTVAFILYFTDQRYHIRKLFIYFFFVLKFGQKHITVKKNHRYFVAFFFKIFNMVDGQISNVKMKVYESFYKSKGI